MRLVGRGWYQSLSVAYEEPPATPVGYFSVRPAGRTAGGESPPIRPTWGKEWRLGKGVSVTRGPEEADSKTLA